jgi:ketosteroid isomerase-like protein
MINDQLKARIKLLNEHLDAEKSYDIEGIMRTYEQDAEVIINGHVFSGHENIRKFHERLGFGQNGGFSKLSVGERHRYIQDEAIIIEQTLSGIHTGTWQSTAATGRSFEVPVCTVYTFGKENKLAGESVYFDSALCEKRVVFGQQEKIGIQKFELL